MISLFVGNRLWQNGDLIYDTLVLMLGKFLGGLFGFMLAGPIGLMLGVLIGHFFDRGFARFKILGGGSTAAQQTFFKITFQVMGFIAKSDGVISEAELDQARDSMRRLNLNEKQRVAAMQAFNDGKSANFSLDAALQELLNQCHNQRMLLQIFIDFQTRAATINGRLDKGKEKILTHICQRLGFAPASNSFNFDDLFRQFNQQSQQQNYQHSSPNKRYPNSLSDAYRVLGIDNKASAMEVKKAYRKMMSQNHPDKLVAQGLPPEMIKLATEKTQKIQAAYEQICTAQGL